MADVLERAACVARFADGARDMAAVMALRGLCFRSDAAACDRDAFDQACRHVLVIRGDAPVCTYRLLTLQSGADIWCSYAAQHYDLSRLSSYCAPLGEVGRFCIAPHVQDADVLRVAWGAMAEFVRAEGLGMLFGCSSFAGKDAAVYSDAFAMLAARHAAPARWRPGGRGVRLDRGQGFDAKLAMAQTPPLLRSYLSMGGWVSDHAVADTDLNTLHVFTGVEVSRIPAARLRWLGRIAG